MKTSRSHRAAPHVDRAAKEERTKLRASAEFSPEIPKRWRWHYETLARLRDRLIEERREATEPVERHSLQGCVCGHSRRVQGDATAIAGLRALPASLMKTHLSDAPRLGSFLAPVEILSNHAMILNGCWTPWPEAQFFSGKLQSHGHID